MRLAARHLATPVLWYRHAQTGATLVLVLNNHIGAAGYWAAMSARIGELDAAGWAVHFEGIFGAPEAGWADASYDELAARAVLAERYRDVPAGTAARLGWVTQKQGLPLGEGWVNADLDDLAVIRGAGADAILAMDLEIERSLARLGAHRAAHDATMTLLILRRLARPHDWIGQAWAKLAPAVHAVLVDQRSKAAAAGIDPARNTVLVYGAEHADGIAAALAEAGWAPTGRRRWLTIAVLPPLPRTLAGIAAVACRVGADTYRAEWARRAG
jgi:hypothetical protein